MKKNYKILILSGLIMLNFFLFIFIDQTKSDELEVYFLDVGQGDSIFIETAGGPQVLIDGGPDNKVVQKLSEVMPFWDRTIDLVILTHPDRDHITGLAEVLKRYKVKGIVETGIECEKPGSENSENASHNFSGKAAFGISTTGKPECIVWQDLKRKEEAANIFAKLGDSVILDKNTKILILNPFDNMVGKKVSKTNNTSVVAKLIYGGYSLLLTGDIEKQIEEKLILAGVDIDTDYLKIPHHGSKTSTTKEFLDNTSPLLAFISLGLNNRYGHPHKEVTERLEKRGIKYYRTDVSGTILLGCKLNQPCRVENQK